MTPPESCHFCDTPLPAGAKFCAECGQPVARACPACGTPAGSGRFCAECGTPLAAAPKESSPPPAARQEHDGAAPVAERRIVSLLFADLVGFTTLSESRDPEEVRELLSAYFDRARAVIERYGGTVEKFIGDAVFAVWGVPAAREDDAERAVRAGLDLTSAVTALGEEVGIPGLAMRVGVTTGQVAVTLGAVGEGMVAGDAVNTAARVQAAAAPGQVWVDDTTRSLTTASLAYDAVGSFDLKGKAVPVALFHALRTTGHVGGMQRVDGLEAPFVGRDRDLGLVKELWHAAVEEGRPRFVLVTGDPGVGKSRLAWEFEKYVDAIPTQTTYWMRGRCLAYGEGAGSRVVAELIRFLLRLTETDDDATVRSVLADRLARHIPDPADRAVIGPRLLALLGLTDETFETADLFACWRAFLESLHAEGDSVTMVVEDLHWGDAGLFDFLEHLLEAARVPIFILGLARAEVTETRPGIGTGRRATTLFLAPLRDESMAALLDGLVGHLPRGLRDELVRRAEGVPLYGVETIRALIDRDIVVPRDGRYDVDHAAAADLNLDQLGPPASLQALLAARLDALSEAERRVVQDASVLGSTFPIEAIRTLSPDDLDLEAALTSLRHKEILGVETDPRSPERGQYRFVQALLRTVAYDTLSRRDRHTRHLAVASYLAALPEHATLASIIARHYLDAAQAMPDAPETAAAIAEARRLLEVAADHALSTGAPRNAATLLDRLLESAPPDEVVIRVTARRADLAMRLEEPGDQQLRMLEPAIDLATRLDLPEDVLELQLSRGLALVRAGHAADSLAQLEDVMRRCLGHPQRVKVLSRTVRGIALAAQAIGDPRPARDATQRAMDDIERFGDDADFALYLSTMSMYYGTSGYRRLTSIIRRATVPLFAERDPHGLIALLNLVATQLNDNPVEAWDATVEVSRRTALLGLTHTAHRASQVMLASLLGTAEAITVARGHVLEVKADGQTGSPDWEAYLAAAAGLLALHVGDADLLLPAVDSEADTTDPVSHGWWLMREAAQAALEGDDDRAGELAATAVDGMTGLGLAHEDMPGCFALAVDLMPRAGMWQRLEDLTARFEGLATGQRFRVMHGTLLRARAKLSADPVPGLADAVAVFDGISAWLPAASTRVELAEALHASGRYGDADPLLAVAEPFLRQAGALPWLERVAALQAAAVASG